ncbi:MAG TPA: hypothetical protein VFK89_07650 [Actinomycetota bacterium]|nr:hypothetical protein [Actinomycetota bacterium]
MRSRRAAALALAVVVTAIGGASAAPHNVRLPSAADVIRKQIAAEQLLRGGRGPERTLPGRVFDREKVAVAVDPAGRAMRVAVEQTLRLRGIGDYFFKIPGPVHDVEALANSSAQPGLRKGSVLWQGFASGHEVLAARLLLDPEQERARLPLAVALSLTVDGDPVTGRRPVSGRLVIRLELRNATRSTLATGTATVDRGRTLDALAATRTVLESHRRPEPGSNGIPRALPALSDISTRVLHPIAPVAATVDLELPRGTKDVTVGGAAERDRSVHLRRTLSRSAMSVTTTVTATVHRMTLPELTIAAHATPPPSSEASVSPDASSRRLFDRLTTVLGDVAQLHSVDGYVGNPDRAGPAETAYRWTLVPREEVVEPPLHPRPDQSANPLAIALAILIALGLVAGAVVWWSLS